MAKILIVEDDRSLRSALTAILKQRGDEVLNAGNGMDGLSIASKENPDLIVLDYLMPKLDGLETAKLMRRDKMLKTVPMIIMTASSDKNTIMSFLKLGVSYFFAKPFDYHMFIEKVRNVLEFELARRPKKQAQTALQEKTTELLTEKQTIIICEPNKDLADALVQALNSEYKLITADNGAICLYAISQSIPQAVLIEPESRFFTGYEIAARVKSIPEFEKVKLIAFSSPDNSIEVKKYADYFDSIIEKPYSIQKVMATLSDLIGQHYQISENEKNMHITLLPNCAKWAAGNPAEAIRNADTILLKIFETRISSLIIDTTKMGGAEPESIDFAGIIAERAEESRID